MPDALGIPFPSLAPTTLPLALMDFTGSRAVSIGIYPPSDSFPATPPLPFFGGVQSAYLQRLGVCAYDVDIQSSIVNKITSTLPGLVDTGIAQKAVFDGISLNATARTTVDVASFINRTNIAAPYGGLVTIIDANAKYAPLLIAGGAVPSTENLLNYTFTFGFTYGPQSGIFSLSPALNAWRDEGGVADLATQIRDGLETAIPSTLANTVYLQALAARAQPVPTGVLEPNPACSGSGNLPSSCYVPCHLPPEGFTPPAKLDPSKSVDDSSWYDTSYCESAANIVLANGAAKGASIYGIADPNTQTAIGELFQQTRPGQPNLYKYVRCNFYPTYETDASPVPVCEFVVHAKRMNVLPGTAELVWFDGQNLAPISSSNPGVDSSEYSNEAFATYLLLLVGGQDTGKLCQSTAQQAAASDGTFALAPLAHHFAHGAGSQ